MPSKNHIRELQEISNRIYEYAAGEITKFCEKRYGNVQEDTSTSQMEDFRIIADEVCAYLMGNALAMVDDSCLEDDLHTVSEHIRQVRAYVCDLQQKQMNDPLN